MIGLISFSSSTANPVIPVIGPWLLRATTVKSNKIGIPTIKKNFCSSIMAMTSALCQSAFQFQKLLLPFLCCSTQNATALPDTLPSLPYTLCLQESSSLFVSLAFLKSLCQLHFLKDEGIRERRLSGRRHIFSSFLGQDKFSPIFHSTKPFAS